MIGQLCRLVFTHSRWEQPLYQAKKFIELGNVSVRIEVANQLAVALGKRMSELANEAE